MNNIHTSSKKRRLPTGRGGDYYNPVTPKGTSTGNPQRTAPSETSSKSTTTQNNPPTTKSTASLPTSRGGDYYNPTTPKSSTSPNPQRPSMSSAAIEEKPESESPSTSERIWDTITGSTKQALGNFGSGVSTYFQSSQSNLLRDDEVTYNQKAKQYAQMLSDNQTKPGTWDEAFLKVKEKELNAAKRMLDVGKQAVTNSSLVQGANVLRDGSAALSRSGAQDIARAKENLGPLGRFAVDVGAAGTQLVGDAALAALTGGVGVLPVKAVQAFGSGAEQARAAGADLDQQATYGLANAALNLGTEKLFNLAAPLKKTYGAGLLESPLSEALESFRETAPIRMGLSALTEGGEEFAEALVQPLLQRATYDPDAKIDPKDAFYQGLVGSTVGALAGGTDAISELDFSDGFLLGFLGEEVTQDPVLLHESLLQAKDFSEQDPITWALVDAWDYGLQTNEKLNDYYTKYLSSIGAENTELDCIDKYINAKYSNSPEYEILSQYADGIVSGWMSPLSGFDNYQTIHKQITSEIIGHSTANNIAITRLVPHFMHRVIGTAVDPKKLAEELTVIRRSGVEVKDVKNALFSPKSIGPVLVRKSGQRSVKFIGENCVVSINPDTGALIQTNPRRRNNDV